MYAKRMKKGSTIGLFCPSHVGDMQRYNPSIEAMERLGYKVKLGDNFCKDTYGYAASAEERAADLNALVADKEVDMVLFSGGDSAVEILPLIDYDNIRRHPKLFCSYSDATPILNAIHAQTGIVTYYGPGVGEFSDLRHYNYEQFCANFMEGYSVKKVVKDSNWRTLNSGICRGTLLGGYAGLVALMLGNPYFHYEPDEKYLLFLEDHEHFNEVGGVSTYLAFIEQNPFMKNVTGLIFGHYAAEVPEELLGCLTRFGQRNKIPVVYTDDFGHGTRHMILPIGVKATLDADQQCLTICE